MSIWGETHPFLNSVFFVFYSIRFVINIDFSSDIIFSHNMIGTNLTIHVFGYNILCIKKSINHF